MTNTVLDEIIATNISVVCCSIDQNVVREVITILMVQEGYLTFVSVNAGLQQFEGDFN